MNKPVIISLLSGFLLIWLASCASLTGGPAATPTPEGPMYQNPILREDFPDSFILRSGDTFYAYATNGAFKHVQAATSKDLVHWQMLGDALPKVPKWASSTFGLTWAPEVIQIGDRYVMYYTSRDVRSNKQCVGVAVSDRPEGTFTDQNKQPLVCQSDEGGTIDASPFNDGDKLYLYFKNDGNCCKMKTHIYVQEMAPDGLSMVGTPVPLIVNDQPWEGGVIEAPTMVKHLEKYYLFYSANDYGGAKYAVGYALCDTAVGPCTDAPENPILKSRTGQNSPVIGPGHQAVFEQGGQTWIFYHAWEANAQGQRTNRRLLWLDRLDWVDEKPVVRGPTSAPQAAPVVK